MIISRFVAAGLATVAAMASALENEFLPLISNATRISSSPPKVKRKLCFYVRHYEKLEINLEENLI